MRVEINRNGITLAGRLLLPPAERAAAVVLVHGLGSGKDSPRNVVIAERLRDSGLAVLLFDLSGHGESDTDGRGDELDAYSDDLTAAFRWLTSRDAIDRSRIGVAGSSLGAVVALDALTGGRIAPASMVLRAPPIGPDDLERVAVPTLVIVGSRDPLSRGLQAVRRSREVELVIVPGAGHLFEEEGTLKAALDHTVSWFGATLRSETRRQEARQ
jgi:putative phosphoribosyl transferase